MSPAKRHHVGNVFPYRDKKIPGWEAWMVMWNGDLCGCAYPTQEHAREYLNSLFAKAEKDIGADCVHCGEPASHLHDDGYAKPTEPMCDECDPEEPRGDSHPLGGMGYGYSYGRDR